jgi:hypothetical protein
VVTLVHPAEKGEVSALTLLSKCDLFKTNLPYSIPITVSVDVFRQFVAALEDPSLPITPASLTGLTRLSGEFSSEELVGELSEFRESATFKYAQLGEDLEARARIAELEERALTRDREITALQESVRDNSEIAALKIAALKIALREKSEAFRLVAENVKELEMQITSLSSHVDSVEENTRRLTEAQIERVNGTLQGVAAQVEAMVAEAATPKPVPDPLILGRFDSMIVRDSPSIFDHLRDRKTVFAKTFRRHGDDHESTLMIVVDVNGYIFGAFSPNKMRPMVGGLQIRQQRGRFR